MEIDKEIINETNTDSSNKNKIKEKKQEFNITIILGTLLVLGILLFVCSIFSLTTQSSNTTEPEEYILEVYTGHKGYIYDLDVIKTKPLVEGNKYCGGTYYLEQGGKVCVNPENIVILDDDNIPIAVFTDGSVYRKTEFDHK